MLKKSVKGIFLSFAFVCVTEIVVLRCETASGYYDLISFWFQEQLSQR